MVTPLREILDRTYLRLGRGHRPRPRRPHGGAAQPRGRERAAALRPADPLGRLGLADPAGARAWTSHAIGFKSLADAIWLRNHVVESLELANSSEDPAQARAAADLRLRRRRIRRARGAGRAAGLRRGRDGPLPARPAARHALDPGRGDRPGPARDRPQAGRLRAAPSCAGAGSRSGSAPPWSRSRPTPPPSRPARRSRPGPSSGRPAWSRIRAWRGCRVPLDERGRVQVDETLRVQGQEGVWALGDCAAVPEPGRVARRRPPPSTASARRAWSPDNVAAALRGDCRRAATATPAAPPSSTSAATRPWAGSGASPSAASSPGGWRGPTT